MIWIMWDTQYSEYVLAGRDNYIKDINYDDAGRRRCTYNVGEALIFTEYPSKFLAGVNANGRKWIARAPTDEEKIKIATARIK